MTARKSHAGLGKTARMGAALLAGMILILSGRVEGRSVSGDSYTIAEAAALTGAAFVTGAETENHPQGTRGAAAAALLLSYYDARVNGSVLSGETPDAAAAHAYLITNTDYFAGGVSFPANDAEAVNRLLSDSLKEADFGARAAWGIFSDSVAVSKIQADEPVSLYTASGSVVVAYGYRETEQGLFYKVHTVTKDASGNAVYDVEIQASEAVSMLYLNTASNHIHTLELVRVSETSHTGECADPDCAVRQESPHAYDRVYVNEKHRLLCECGFEYIFSGHDCTTGICPDCGQPVEHTFAPATCRNPATCLVCGITAGNTLPHEYAPATCFAPQTCVNCGAKNGGALDHTWQTVTSADGHYQKCSLCGSETGFASHAMQTHSNGSSGHYQKCTACGYQGSTVSHNMGSMSSQGSAGHGTSCSVCGYSSTSPHNYTATYYDSSGHWQTCGTCGYSSGSSGHYIPYPCSGGYCSGCNYYQSPWGHSYSGGYCVYCGQSDPYSHTHSFYYTWMYMYYATVCRREGYYCSCGMWSSYTEYPHMLGQIYSCYDCMSYAAGIISEDDEEAWSHVNGHGHIHSLTEGN